MSGVWVAVIGLGACRGDISTEPPVHLNQNMDFQARFDPQEENAFFADGRAQRPPVPGTVAQDELKDDDHLYRGKVNGQFASTLPMPVSAELLGRGKDRFEIYCAPCHDAAGTGQGVVAKRGQKFGMVALPDFRSERLVAMASGQIFDAISNGVRGMPSYGAQIPVHDRWAIVAYLRALQISGRARLADIPAEVKEQLGLSVAAATMAPAAATTNTQAPAEGKSSATTPPQAKPDAKPGAH
jgi:mono/diheme cytochrome c family protein